jgi:hypothetical protein
VSGHVRGAIGLGGTGDGEISSIDLEFIQIISKTMIATITTSAKSFLEFMFVQFFRLYFFFKKIKQNENESSSLRQNAV